MAVRDSQVFCTQGGVTNLKSDVGDILNSLLGRSGSSGFGAHSTADQVTADWNGAGHVALITGAASGLGYESARALARRGCEVVIAARSQARADAAADNLLKLVPGARISGMELDLSNLRSVKLFAEQYLATGKPLDILMLNAGVMGPPFSQSADGYELQFATNHLGHFLLTRLLLDHMLNTAQASGREGRVVVVSSLAHQLWTTPEGILFDKLGTKDYQGYSQTTAYGVSKLCNILFTRELNRRLSGRPVVAVCCHPGTIADTQPFRHVPAPKWAISALTKATFFLYKSVQQGAATQVFLAAAKGVAGGEYYVDCNVGRSSARAHDADMAARLWQFSEKAVEGVGATAGSTVYKAL